MSPMPSARPSAHNDRLIDEMAVTLLGVPEMGDDEACILALWHAGYTEHEIRFHMIEARELAREVRAQEIDAWAGMDLN
jgi:hypothetical protein